MSQRFNLNSPRCQVAEEIRRRIATGELAGDLPGIRRLMSEFGATRTTVEGALEELRHGGHLVCRGKRKPMKIVRHEPAPGGEGTLIVHADPMERRTGDHREILLAMEEHLPPPVVRLSLPQEDARTEKIVARILESPFRRIVVMDHDAEVADRLMDAGRIVVAAGTGGEPTLAPQVCVSHEMLVRGAVRKAFQAGHRRVSFPLWRRLPEVAANMRRWIAAEYSLAGYKHSPQFDAPVVDGREPAALHRTLRDLLRHTPPTALVASDFQQWLATVMVLGETGLRMPRDVSLICLCSTPEWESATPTPAHFRFPVAAMVLAVARSLAAAERGAHPAPVSLAPEWVPGHSLGAPSSAGKPADLTR